MKEGIRGEREGDFTDNFITRIFFFEGGHFEKWNMYFWNCPQESGAKIGLL